jgi:hypothetical protein
MMQNQKLEFVLNAFSAKVDGFTHEGRSDVNAIVERRQGIG